MLPPFIAKYWGKARSEHPDGPKWHPLAYHALDVAAVADELLLAAPRRLEQMARLAGHKPEALRRLFVVLVSLHDLGKLSREFQAKSELGPLGQLAPPPPSVRHDAIGYLLRDATWSGVDAALAGYFSDPDDLANCGPQLWAAVTGHHGEPAITVGSHWENGFRDNRDDVAAFVSAMTNVLPRLDERAPKIGKMAPFISWQLAGLTNLTDWIGSSQAWFAYTAPSLTLEQYWVKAKDAAATAVRESGVLPSSYQAKVNAPHLLPHLKGSALSPLQQQALECVLPDGPMLAIIEDVTGAGKTEAALLLAARLISENRSSGLFFALPTMATANAMYERLSQSYRRLFDDDTNPSLVLAHGKRALHEGFRASILDRAAVENEMQDQAESAADVTASAACSRWIADDRRKAFLADVGVGTIDQALLGVLPSRFQALRLWGLSDRVLICDEVHSFDSYLSRELETLLEFHAALGGSAVVLSATLSIEARQRLVSAFRKGLGARTQPATEDAYPLLTLVGARSVIPLPVPARPEIKRSLAVRRIGSASEAVAEVVALSRRGAAVAWIRNAVDDVIDADAMLRCQGVEPIVLHARFAMGDRLDIEERVQRALGRASTANDRRSSDGRGLVVIGSQILEQSLDYDVDGMISDLAPVDMVIQRAGRLWRHPGRTGRPLSEAERALLLLSPDPGGDIAAAWYKELSARAAAVYPDHGYVWRSAKALLEAGVIATPDGVRGLLANVYDEQIATNVPSALERANAIAFGNRSAARAIAANNSLKVAEGYAGPSNVRMFSADTLTPTRLGEPVAVFRLAKREAGRIVPWYPLTIGGNSLARAWALSECSVRQAMSPGVPEPTGQLAVEVAAAKEAWPKWEREQPLLLLEAAGDGLWRGTALDKDKRQREVLYDRRIGWRMLPA